MTMEDVEHFIASSAESEVNVHRAIESDGEYAGTISFKNIDTTSENAELAISLRTTFQGTGVASEAMVQAAIFAQKSLKFHKLYLNVLSDNERAIRFYQKAGFAYEGRSPEQAKIDGVFRDLLWFGLLLGSSK